MNRLMVAAVFFVTGMAHAQEADLSRLDKCQNAAIEIAKIYLLKDPRLSQSEERVEFDAPGQTFGSGGTLIYCVTGVNYKTRQMVSQDVVLNSVDCREVMRMDRSNPESACRELDDLNSNAHP